MKAVGFRAPHPIDHPESLVDLELPDPTPGPHDLLVQVRAVSVNPVDTKIRKSATPPAGEARILGWDASVVVEAVGANVRHFKAGDEVYYAGTIGRPGTNSEKHCVDERLVGKKPRSLSFEQAAAMPLVCVTAWELLFDRMHVPHGKKRAGGTLLVVNGAGGVGSVLIQIARRLTGLTVVATASRDETRKFCHDMGAHHIIDHRQPLHEELKRIGIPNVEYIAALTASDQHHAAFAEAIAPQGTIGIIDDPKSWDIVPFKRKSVTVAWELMYTRSIFETPDMIEQHHILNEVSHLLEGAVLRHTMTENAGKIDAATLKKVHAKIESGKAVGKTVLAGF